jgi:hypothetical protein
MKHRVESTAPALLEGPGRLLARDDLMQAQDLGEIPGLARRLLPRLFPDRSGSTLPRDSTAILPLHLAPLKTKNPPLPGGMGPEACGAGHPEW